MMHKDTENRVHSRQNDGTGLDDVYALRLQLAQRLVRALAVVGLLAALAGTYDAIETRQMWTIPTYWVAYGIVLVLALWRNSPYRLRVWSIIVLLYVMGVVDFVQDGSRGSARAFMLAIPFLTGVFLDRRANFVAILLNVLTMGGFGLAYSAGWLRIPDDPIAGDPSRWVTGTMVVFMLDIMIVGSLNYLIPRFEASLKRSHELTRALQVSRDVLESQVNERTSDLARRADYLAATSQVASEAATVLADPQQLLTRVVNLISERFAFYHAGIFLLDPGQEWAVLQAASSEGGQRMLERGHRLRVGAEGTVGYVTQQGVSRIALDVGDDAVFFSNPDLPRTRSAITLPLRARGEIIGALDVQSTLPGAFSTEDAETLQALADQVAVAISNARLFRQAQESAIAERRARGEMTREAWNELLRVQHELGFAKEGNLVAPASRRWDQEMETVLQTGEPASGPETEAALAVPIKVGDQVVAVLDAHLPDDAGGWTTGRVELLNALSVQIGEALERARLYEATQRRAVRERLVGEVMGRMRESLDIDTVMQTTVREIVAALQLARVEVRLGVPQRSTASEQ